MIGVFDSGAGGLTVIKEIHEQLPGYSTLYFGDTARFPYGSKTASQLRQYAREDAELLIANGAAVVVAACHSASSMAGDLLRQELAVPFFDMVTPSITAALAATRRGRIGVVGTRATVGSNVYQTRLPAARPDLGVTVVAAPMLVPLVEERWWKHPEARRIIRRSLAPFKRAQVDTLVLACTHYPLIETLIQGVMGKNVLLINPAREVVRTMQQFFTEHREVADKLKSASPVARYIVSSDPEHFRVTARAWLGHDIAVEEVHT